MSGVEWVLLAKSGARAGDLVSAEAGGMPIYRIVEIRGGEAWLQSESRDAVRVVPLDRLHWKAKSARGSD